jgi:hypothetical protein
MLAGNSVLPQQAAAAEQQRRTAPCKGRDTKSTDQLRKNTGSRTARNSGLSRKSPSSCRTAAGALKATENMHTEPHSPGKKCTNEFACKRLLRFALPEVWPHKNQGPCCRACFLWSPRWDSSLRGARQATLSTKRQRQLNHKPTSFPSEVARAVPCFCPSCVQRM